MSEAENVNFTNLKNEAIAFRDDALGKLETSALGATVGFLSSLTSTLSSFREMVSNPLDTLSTSLQGQLRDLTNLDIDLAAGIADPIAAARNIAQSSNLLESIKTDFGQSLTDAGFDVDSLVSDASAAVSAGKSLSGIIPNFELNSIGDIVLKASGVKLPAIDPVKELTATFVDNVDFIQAGSDAVSDLQTLLDFYLWMQFKKLSPAILGCPWEWRTLLRFYLQSSLKLIQMILNGQIEIDLYCQMDMDLCLFIPFCI